MQGIKLNYDKYQLIVAGCGGTGSALLYFLSRFLYNLDKDILVTLVDGDKVEEKNVLRQSFAPADIGENKAKVLAVRYANLLGIRMSYSEQYIKSSDDLDGLILPERFPVIAGCLDNTKARLYLHELFKIYRNIAYVDGGNGESRGQVVFGLRYYGSNALPPAGYYFPDLIEPEPKAEEESYRLGCADVHEQTMGANFLSAHVLFSYLSNIFAGTETRHMTLFDAKSMEVINKPINKCQEFYTGCITGYRWAGGIDLIN